MIGRKNWLFSGSPRGASASTLLHSLIETAKANGREPYAYLRELFEKLPLARTRADYLMLLPTARPPPAAAQRLPRSTPLTRPLPYPPDPLRNGAQ